MTAESAGKKPKQFHIKIDRTQYEVDDSTMTGAQLRALPNPPIPEDRDLWEVVPGGDDVKVADDSVVEIRNGKRFFTTPAKINPGATDWA